MIPQELVDAIVLITMLVVRVGLPLGLVLTVGYWLQKKLRPMDVLAADAPKRAATPGWYGKVMREIHTLPAWLPFIALMMVVGLCAMVYRLSVGLGATTNLNQAYPWGLWIGFDLFMVAFSGGAFTLAALVYIFQMHSLHAALRPTVLTGLLGYAAVLLILVMDLGRWDRFYHFMIYPNISSALFEVSWCILLYSCVLISEFSPVIMERFGWHRAMAFIKKITVPLVIVGVTLSTLHQSSLGSLFVIMSERLHPLWYTPMIPLLFFISSIAAGLAMVIAGATVSYWVFKRSLPQHLVGNLAIYLPLVLGVYVLLKLGDLALSGEIALIWTSGVYSTLFISELVIGVFIPIIWFSLKRTRASRTLSLLGAILVLAGIFLNRFDAAWWGLKPVVGYSYLPSPIEIMIQVGAICWIITVYTLVGHYLPLFEGTVRREEESESSQPVLAPRHAY